MPTEPVKPSSVPEVRLTVPAVCVKAAAAPVLLLMKKEPETLRVPAEVTLMRALVVPPVLREANETLAADPSVIALPAVPSVTTAPTPDRVPLRASVPAPVLVSVNPPPVTVPATVSVLPLAADQVWLADIVSGALIVRLPVAVMAPPDVRVNPPPAMM